MKDTVKNIVMLDVHNVNPGDYSWAPIEKFGNLTVYPRTKTEEIIDRAKKADIIVVNKLKITAKTIEQLPNLKMICVIATGYDVIDLEAAKRNNIVVCNIPDYCTYSVAQLTFAHILAYYSQAAEHYKAVSEGMWVKSKDFSFSTRVLYELQDKNLAVLGYGQIGSRVAEIALAFGMKVSVFSRSRSKARETTNVKFVSKEELFASSDILSLHCPLTPETEEIVNKETLTLMKKTAILINTSRGALINEKDLSEALNEGVIAAAYLDVLAKEPPLETNPLLRAKHCYITPHIAWASYEARGRLIHMTAKNIKAFLENKAINVVS